MPSIVVRRTAPTRFCCILGKGSPVCSLFMLTADTFFGRSRISLWWRDVLKFYLAEVISGVHGEVQNSFNETARSNYAISQERNELSS